MELQPQSAQAHRLRHTISCRIEVGDKASTGHESNSTRLQSFQICFGRKLRVNYTKMFASGSSNDATNETLDIVKKRDTGWDKPGQRQA
eukprot:6311897-Amphidinium_carterae.1